MYRFVIQGKVHVRHPRQRIGRGAGKGNDCHADVFGNPCFIQHLLRFAAARDGNKNLIACGIAEKNISAVSRPGDKRRFAQNLQLLGQVLRKQIRKTGAVEKEALFLAQQVGKLLALLLRDPPEGVLIVGDELIKQRREFWKGGRLSGNMWRVGK